MNWYIAKIVFRITTENTTHKEQFDEHLRLVKADCTEEAVLKARLLGLSEEDYFLNSKNQGVRWEFINIIDVQPIAELKDGVELYSQIQEYEQAEAYIHYVHLRAAALQRECTPA